MIIFGGPNGSGKSTLQRALFDGNPELKAVPFLNADNKAIEEGLSVYDAAAKIIAEAYDKIALGESFAWETVMSHPSKIDAMKHAQAHGFHVHLYFLGTNNSDINVANVATRVTEGGHDVPENKIRERWDHIMADTLFQALDTTDSVEVYNSLVSVLDIGIQHIASVSKKRVSYAQEPPAWLRPEKIVTKTKTLFLKGPLPKSGRSPKFKSERLKELD